MHKNVYTQQLSQKFLPSQVRIVYVHVACLNTCRSALLDALQQEYTLDYSREYYYEVHSIATSYWSISTRDHHRGQMIFCTLAKNLSMCHTVVRL